MSDMYLLIKRGSYWRPSALGYTNFKEAAGRYTFEYASRRINEEVTMIKESEAPEFTKECCLIDKERFLSKKLRQSKEREKMLLEALEEVIKLQKDNYGHGIETHVGLASFSRRAQQAINTYKEMK